MPSNVRIIDIYPNNSTFCSIKNPYHIRFNIRSRKKRRWIMCYLDIFQRYIHIHSPEIVCKSALQNWRPTEVEIFDLWYLSVTSYEISTPHLLQNWPLCIKLICLTADCQVLLPLKHFAIKNVTQWIGEKFLDYILSYFAFQIKNKKR